MSLKSIGFGESTTVEWKPSLSQIHEIIESITAFANTEGGRLFVGISKTGEGIGVQIGKGTVEGLVNRIAQHTDPKIQPKITVKKIKGKQVIVIEVKQSKDRLVLADGRPYKRVGPSTRQMGKDEYEGLILEKHKGKHYFDEQICDGAKISDVSREKLLAFIKEAKRERGLSIAEGLSVTDILRKLKLVKNDKLTNGAILLFGKDTQNFFLQSELKAVRFKGLDETRPMLDFKTIGGDAITLLKKAEGFIYDHIPMRAWIQPGKLQRQEKWLYPEEAIREALANALAHRDYSSPGKVQVRIFDDRLEIWNPGLLPPPLTLEKLKGKHDSVPRNPLIAKAFFWIKYAEDVGSGTSKIIQWCKEWGLPEPTYEEAGASFVTVFHNPKPEDGGQQGGQKQGPETGARKLPPNKLWFWI
ncbi:MAG: ATP-binding protein [Candidatus Omnitrophota bacterium]|nr:ATP-binding protein [Candidatus Omnitrophota bacterium]